MQNGTPLKTEAKGIMREPGGGVSNYRQMLHLSATRRGTVRNELRWVLRKGISAASFTFPKFYVRFLLLLPPQK